MGWRSGSQSTPVDGADFVTPHRGVIAAAATTAVLTIANSWWLLASRSHGPIDIDEANYLTLATAATADIQAGDVLHGLGSLWLSSASGPLLPVVTVPWQLLVGRTTTAGLLANLTFFVLLAAATYALARHWLTPAWSVLTLGVVLTAPGITDFARSYVFALASTATFTIAIAALVASDRFRRRIPAVAFGVAIGLTLLARTVMVAFVPGLVLAGAVAWLQNGRGGRAETRGNALLAAGVAVATTASWYAFSLTDVLDYLFDFGYGGASEDYGTFGWRTAQYWLSDAADLVTRNLFLPLALVLLAGGTLGALSWVRPTQPHRLRRVARSDAVLVAIPVAVALAALITSRNTGYGFTLPLVPPVVVLGMQLITRIPARTARGAFAVALGLVAALNLAMQSGLAPALGDERVAWSNDWARLTITDGRSNIARYLAVEAGFALSDDDGVPRVHEGWLTAARATTDLVRRTGDPGDVRALVTVDGPLYNANLLALVPELDADPRLRLVAFETDGTSDEALDAAFAAALGGGVNVVITGPARIAWTGEGLDQGGVERASERAGLTAVGEVVLPEGGTVRVWSLGR